MATVADLTRYIDSTLRAIENGPDFPPEPAEGRAVRFMRLRHLDDARAREMTDEQGERYRALRDKPCDLPPPFRRLGLSLPRPRPSTARVSLEPFSRLS